MKMIKQFCKEFFWRCIVPTAMVFGAIIFAILISAALVSMVI